MDDGRYTARAVQAVLGRTKGGAPQIAVEFKLENGQTRTWYGYFTDGTRDRTIEALRFCGWRGSDLTDLTGIDTNDVSLVLETEEWEGKRIQKIQWVNRLGGIALVERMGENEARAFAASMKGAVLAVDQEAGTNRDVKRSNSAAQRPASPTSPRGDDIPF